MKNSNTLKELVKEIQFKKDWTIEQVAESIGYSRVHLTKEMAKKEENEMMTSLLLKTHADILKTRKASIIEDVDAFLVSNLVRQEAMLQTIMEFLADIGGPTLNRTPASVLASLHKRVEEKEAELISAAGKTS